MRYQTLAVIGLVAVGAAGCSKNQSVGFTGIGSEPATVTQRAPDVRTVAPATVSYTPSYVPSITAPAAGGSVSARAETAIRYGGTEPRRSIPVAMGGRMLALSIVDVGGQDFAVLRTPSSMPEATIPDAAKSEFQNNAASLTGCLPQGAVHASGASRKGSAGLAIPLNCN